MNSDKLGYDLLSHIGYKVTPIPTSDKMEADFLVEFGGYSALVEAKLKKDSTVATKEREESYITGQPYLFEHRMGRNETLSGIVRKASHQLKSSSDKKHNFKLMLFVATGYVAEKQAEQFMGKPRL